jgi:hypothetical protein
MQVVDSYGFAVAHWKCPAAVREFRHGVKNRLDV